MTNAEIADVFEQIAKVLDLQGENPFRIRAYDRAAQTITALSEELKNIYARGGHDALLEIPGIGQDLSDKIVELLKTGKLKYLAEVQKKLPKGLFDIMEVPGMGPKKTKFLWETFKVKDLKDLEALAKSDKLIGRKGWGPKSIENILTGIEAKKTHGSRVALPIAFVIAEQIANELRATKLCTKVEVAGSVRRRKETIGDIDILVASKKPTQVMDVFCNYDDVEAVVAKGPTKSSVRLKSGLNADLRVVDENVFGAAWHYFTGSKDHNVHVRRIGLEKGFTISEYGVYKGTAKEKGKLLASKTEEDVYKAVGLPYIEPELREDRGEIEAAYKGKLPHLIELTDIKGDLHLHSNFSDGSATMIDMARAAKELGHQYIAITDHGSPMGMVYGIKEKNIKEYLKKINEARKAVSGIHILAGTEVDILEDGSLYLPDKILKQLDWVVASVHGNFKMPPAAMTKRILKAIENPYVDIIAHPTSRLLLKREPIEYDMDAVMKAAAKRGVLMELNASIYRLDLNDIHCKRAKELGVMLSIDSDAHHFREYDYRFGITQARRGWIEKKDVLNTKTWKELEVFLKKRKKGFNG
ncbi:MAG TPA: DNA polymerase/3'-5' exonuclease PolX [Candidatus Peribacteraceae bacterium]|nr:DNA polymerase/3'-5' exonuclease PolX [Candidatus Peribacteraceae bacterium]